MQKSIDPVQPNLDVMKQNGCQIQIQRPKNIENNHSHHLCISKLFFVTQCNCHFSENVMKMFPRTVCIIDSVNESRKYRLLVLKPIGSLHLLVIVFCAKRLLHIIIFLFVYATIWMMYNNKKEIKILN